MFDLQVEELKQDLVKRINESNLPATILVYVLKDLLQSALSVMNTQIAAQKAAQSKEEDK